MTTGTEQEYLEPWQMDAVNYFERIHSVTGALPSDDDTIKYLNLLKHDVSLKDLDKLKENKLFVASMDSRGIRSKSEFLSARQLAAASAMLNLTDRRSDEKKLRDLGISTEEFSTWMLNKHFAAYMRDRAEQMVDNSMHEAHMGLMRGVKSGNTASIKLYYEMTGRYNPNAESEVNVRLVIGRVLEAIQRRVRDPKTLNELAVELSQIAIESGSPVANNTISGQSTRKEIF
ncbi:phBC6A51 family helix-turn-helix protein [Streptomyces rochei]|uniref:phBC6A51 family helix-turn-helix protein n=1 Tax=Streptomyces rochei TaxID=1928 RepID=UPI00367FAFAC